MIISYACQSFYCVFWLDVHSVPGTLYTGWHRCERLMPDVPVWIPVYIEYSVEYHREDSALLLCFVCDLLWPECDSVSRSLLVQYLHCWSHIQQRGLCVYSGSTENIVESRCYFTVDLVWINTGSTVRPRLKLGRFHRLVGRIALYCTILHFWESW